MSNILPPNFNLPEFRLPPIEIPDLPTHHMWADTLYVIVKNHISMFENTLDAEHEVGMMLTSFGQSVLMHVTEISYEKSVVLIFKGYVNDNLSTLIQHINQLNFLLTSVKIESDRPKRKIGFVIPDNE